MTAFRRLKREAHKFEASPGYKGNPGQQGLHNETLSKIKGKHQKNLCSGMTVWSACVLVWFLSLSLFLRQVSLCSCPDLAL